MSKDKDRTESRWEFAEDDYWAEREEMRRAHRPLSADTYRLYKAHVDGRCLGCELCSEEEEGRDD